MHNGAEMSMGSDHASPVERAGTPAVRAFMSLFGARAAVRARHQLCLVRQSIAALWSAAKLPAGLVSARSHDLLLTYHRMLLIKERLSITATFLGISTLAWIPIDIALFHADWSLVLPLIASRVVASALFFAVAGSKVRRNTSRDAIESLALVVAIGIVFFLFAHRVIMGSEAAYMGSAGHAQYVLMPIALIAGIAIFPLTLKEVLALSLVPLAAIVFEVLHGDGNIIFAQASAAVLLMCAVGTAAVACSLSQLSLFSRLHRESTIDHLTGALSRRAGAELLSLTFASCQKESKPLSLAFIDLDHFKMVNDYYGHECGDRVLRQAAARLLTAASHSNSLIRWGGEEFVLALPGADAGDAAALVAELCRSLGTRPDGEMQTVSVGLAERTADKAGTWQELVALADQRMYAAKKAGRDRLLGSSAVAQQIRGGG